MWYDECIASYGEINYEINKIYCDKNNIELIKCNKRRHVNRHPAWERIPLILTQKLQLRALKERQSKKSQQLNLNALLDIRRNKS